MLAGPISAEPAVDVHVLELGQLGQGRNIGRGRERLASVVPRATTLPDLISGRPEDSTNTPNSMLLPTRSVVSAATPL
jgi:hypothetical protein